MVVIHSFIFILHVLIVVVGHQCRHFLLFVFAVCCHLLVVVMGSGCCLLCVLLVVVLRKESTSHIVTMASHLNFHMRSHVYDLM